MPTERRPNLFIVGAQKAGTSSLAAWLDDHPQVFMSFPKEPGYLAFGEKGYTFPDANGKLAPPSKWVVKSEQEYLDLFAGATKEQPVVGEASTWYLAIPGVAENIKEYSPQAKIVIVLRNPVDRAYSAWSHARRDGLESEEDFTAALAAEANRGSVEYLLRYRFMGKYADQIRAYRRVFPEDQMLILLFDDLQQDANGVRMRLYEFLGITLDHNPQLARRYNRSGIPRLKLLHRLLKSHKFGAFWKRILPGSIARRIKVWLDELNLQKNQPLDSATRSRLIEEWRPEIQKLQELTGIDLDRWYR